ncbi:hypothetical protein R1flu_014136 [Riccia fluitans]|uniref:Uncharacterized protein n=1 Tax=Riccia fluitans TaxID=41844 RepID=A0ABD1YFK3_9MARC
MSADNTASPVYGTGWELTVTGKVHGDLELSTPLRLEALTSMTTRDSLPLRLEAVFLSNAGFGLMALPLAARLQSDGIESFQQVTTELRDHLGRESVMTLRPQEAQRGLNPTLSRAR